MDVISAYLCRLPGTSVYDIKVPGMNVKNACVVHYVFMNVHMYDTIIF